MNSSEIPRGATPLSFATWLISIILVTSILLVFGRVSNVEEVIKHWPAYIAFVAILIILETIAYLSRAKTPK